MQVENVVIINDFNFIQGGASKVAIDTARLLKEKNINIFFFSAVNKKEAEIEGIKYISTNQNEALKENNRLKGIINGIYNFKSRRTLKKLLKTLDREKTVIHIHGWTKALSSSVLDVSFKMKFKVRVTLHDYFTACPNGGYFNYVQNNICNLKPLSWECIKCNCDSRSYGFKLYRLLRQFVQNKIVKINSKLKYVVGISDLSIEILRKTLNKDVIIEKIYNPIEFEETEEKIDYRANKYFLYVGRVSKEKGVENFCRVITDLGFEGIVVGDGNEKERLEKKYPNIVFTGWKEKSEVNEYMKGAKALVFTSLWYETAGLTILEAGVLGIPSIVNKTCAGREFVSKENLYSNLEELKNILKKETFKVSINKNAYSSSKYVEKLLKLYEGGKVDEK